MYTLYANGGNIEDQPSVHYLFDGGSSSRILRGKKIRGTSEYHCYTRDARDSDHDKYGLVVKKGDKFIISSGLTSIKINSVYTTTVGNVIDSSGGLLVDIPTAIKDTFTILYGDLPSTSLTYRVFATQNSIANPITTTTRYNSGSIIVQAHSVTQFKIVAAGSLAAEIDRSDTITLLLCSAEGDTRDPSGNLY